MNMRGGIRRQLQWLGVLPALIMLALLLMAITWQRFQDADAALDRRGITAARYLAAASEFGVLSGNIADLRAQARLAFQQPDIQQVAFHDRDGTLMLSIDRVQVSAERHFNGAPVRYFAAVIYQTPLAVPGELSADVEGTLPEAIGEVSLALSENSVAARQREILMASLAPAVLAILAALWIARQMAARISQPILDLSQLVQKIRGGDYRSRGDAPLDGELATLQSDINQLAQDLERARQEQADAITAMREARHRAESASQAKSEFLAMMSHELRTPMNGVLGMLQLLDMTRLDSTQKDYVQAANESTVHLLDVINDILDFSRVESGRLEFESLYFPLAEVMSSCVANFRYLAEQKGLELRVSGLDQIADMEVCSDPTRLRQILANLLSNAVKFTERGSVTLAVNCLVADQDEAEFEFEVIDTGIGIPAKNLPGLFDAFSQVDSSTSRRFGGTGLGLAIVYRLVALLGGTIEVDSEEGLGTRFRCLLRFNARRIAGAARDTSAGRFRWELDGDVLLVEDNDVNRMVAQHMLEAAGLAVTTATDGEQALALLRTQTFDCVLMDVQMPVMDGLEATRRWREHEQQQALRRTPIIALTANALAGERERCLKAGMDDYLAKPFQRGKLLSLVSLGLRGQG